MSTKASSTVGFERRFNAALAATDVEDFVSERIGDATPRPPNMDRIVTLNRGPFVPAPPALRQLDSPDGALLLDVRDERAFAAGHVPGAINVALASSSFATRAGFVLDPSRPLAIQAASAPEAEQAARGLRSVGFLELAGYLDDPPTPERLEPVDLDELEELLRSGAAEVLDVREGDERDGGYISGTRHVPYRLLRACHDGLGRERPVVTLCESGARAAIAASVLVAAGVDARPVLSGGIRDWQRRGNRTVEFRRCGS
jgi:hydroxyacylglutathione hydrolase